MERFKNYMEMYKNIVKDYLPVREEYKMLRRKGLNPEKLMGDKIDILNRVPSCLFHGSQALVDTLEARVSTQAGKYVYGTDNPMHALFFAIFRNSSIARGHINESYDSDGYHVTYEIDERCKDGLKETFKDLGEINIYVLDGKNFRKPQGDAFIDREWVCGEDVKPLSCIPVNPRTLLLELYNEGVLSISFYKKEKSYVTMFDFLRENYPFGLDKCKDGEVNSFDSMCDANMRKYFPDMFNVYSALKIEIKRIMLDDYSSMGLNEVELLDYKLHLVREHLNQYTKVVDGKKVIDIEELNKLVEAKGLNM